MSISKKIELTIITAVYNRPTLLNRMVDNFSNIDYKDSIIQWVIVDDGSIPKIPLISDMPENIIIEIIRQPNSGKHVAINAALQVAKGDFTIIVDSDDFISQKQYENIMVAIDSHGDNYSGFIAYNEDINGIKFGNLSVVNNVLCKNDIFKIKGDYSRLVKTDIMRKCSFDVYENERFNTEINFWSKIHALTEFKVIETSFVTIEYQSDGLSSKYHDLIRSNPKGVFATLNTIIKLEYDFCNSYKFICNHLSYLDSPYILINQLNGLNVTKKVFVLFVVVLLRMLRGKI